MNIDQVPSPHESHHEDQPNIDSAEQLLASIPEKIATGSLAELKELLPHIQEKINALRDAQGLSTKEMNVQSAIMRLTEYRDQIQDKVATRH